MSGSEVGGVITTREQPLAVGINQKAPAPPVAQNMHLAYSADGTVVYNPVATSSTPYQGTGGGVGFEGSAGGGGTFLPHNLNMSAEEPTKRKRGRPRKYGPDGTMALALTTAAPNVAATPTSGGSVAAFSPPSVPSSATAVTSSLKKRGRPPGSSKKKQLEALGSAGVGFTPHIIIVKAGEDVSSKIMAFSQHGPRAVCILSASGAISTVTLRQAATSGGTATYEGRFDILSLSGSFLLSEVGGQQSRTGGLSVSLSGPNGRVLGGCVAGLLTAASHVQVIVGSFIADGRKESKPFKHMEPLFVSPKITSVGGMTGAGSPTSRVTSESSGGLGSPLNQSTGACTNSNPQGMASMPWK